ncbi:MAG: amino acid ABC transporter substrate-binding protein [Rhodospirillales bacterium]|nr:amino acid ABC transporter substrate-binding protein [Rhodospirillales bacterium]
MRLIAAAFLLPATPALAQNSPGTTLGAVLKKGYVECAVAHGTPGFGFVDSKGVYRRLDADTCRAVAAAVFGDPEKVRLIPTNGAQRLPVLQAGQVDMVSETLTQTQSREAANGLLFAGVNFYDGQSFLVRKSSGVKTAKDLDGASVCVTAGSTSELNLADWAHSNGLTIHPVVFERTDEGRSAYDNGRCDAYSTDSSQLAAIATIMHDPDNQMVLPDVISKEPLGPAVRQGDDQWYEIVVWTLAALITAEELGITQADVDEHLKSESPTVKRLLGQTGDFGKFMALDNRWAYWAIKAVGNYGEMFDRNLGKDSPLKLPRGKNDLWTRGGLMYAAPFR